MDKQQHTAHERGPLLDNYTANELQLAWPIAKAGARLGVCRTKAYELVNSGRLKAVNIAGKRVIPESELQRLVSELLEAA
ncbi:helix-turn-helix domain-containing protein [Solilutibacter silvestris]|uniref:Helix-turn-helix protein n=1 Tax=Solilutibacter silvestris TaxID=1645665 RepID=A0A2K1PYG6_9GAMM|nr:helix-turn-helix domain-containing protein [Lysobacter silvestris]PNS07828.1 helix-turn-helix protein [Lysobacter silvestris]